jgi:hypothetical protein
MRKYLVKEKEVIDQKINKWFQYVAYKTRLTLNEKTDVEGEEQDYEEHHLDQMSSHYLHEDEEEEYLMIS